MHDAAYSPRFAFASVFLIFAVAFILGSVGEFILWRQSSLLVVAVGLVLGTIFLILGILACTRRFGSGH